MKKYFYCFMLGALALSVSSCASFSGPKFSQTSYFVDYRQAADGNVFITESNSVSFEYAPVGSLLVEEIAGKFKEQKVLTDQQSYRKTDPIYGDMDQSAFKNTYRYPSATSALDYAANCALQMGGDGIINLKMTSSLSEDKRPKLTITGMVIKKK